MLKDTLENKTKKENQGQTKDELDLTTHEHKTALKEAYRNFVIPKLLKADIDGILNKAKQHVKRNPEY